jgi:hypothetical protein
VPRHFLRLNILRLALTVCYAIGESKPVNCRFPAGFEKSRFLKLYRSFLAVYLLAETNAL